MIFTFKKSQRFHVHSSEKLLKDLTQLNMLFKNIVPTSACGERLVVVQARDTFWPLHNILLIFHNSPIL